MMPFVLDTSVAMRWLFESDQQRDQTYAWKVLETLDDSEAMVPTLWYLEVVNVLRSAEEARTLPAIDVDRFIEQLRSLRIREDPHTSSRAFNHTMAISRATRLTSYDACYLELAVREGLPVSTLDRRLRTAARKLDVPVFLM